MENPKAEVLPLLAEHLPAIAAVIRHADREEIEAATGIPIAQALTMLLPGSIKAQRIVCDGLTLAIFGDAEHGYGIGVPWLISTEHVEQHPREFLRVCKPEVQDMLVRHHTLINYVDARNTGAVRWLRWLGFDFGDPVPYGHSGLPFYPFTLTREVTPCAG